MAKQFVIDQKLDDIKSAILSTDVAQARITEISIAAEEIKEEKIQEFSEAAEIECQRVVESIPADYTEMTEAVNQLQLEMPQKVSRFDTILIGQDGKFYIDTEDN